MLSASTNKLLQILDEENITVLVGLRDSIRGTQALGEFIQEKSLRPEQTNVLKKALAIYRTSSDLLNEELLKHARTRVIPRRLLRTVDDQFESSQKLRRIESRAQRILPGTIHTSVSPLKMDSGGPTSLKEINDAKASRVLARCRKLFNRIGFVSP